MADIRTDWLTGRTVIIAENRAQRPNEFAAAGAAAVAASVGPCPFCPAQEAQTPATVYARTDELGQWRVRVVPNKFPALAPDDARATGAHEVIIESARHVDRMSALSTAEFADVLEAYRSRLEHWHVDGRFEYGLVFKNLGAPAGASLSHLHSQLIALPDLPRPVAAECKRARQCFAETAVCPYCQLVADERSNGERVVFDRDGLIAFCPFASLQPYETWIMPVEHEPWFEHRSAAASDALAELLRALLIRVEALLPQPAYNLLVRTSAWDDTASACGHWRIEILPRVNPFAGFELATQIHINPLCPTRAARQLRGD